MKKARALLQSTIIQMWESSLTTTQRMDQQGIILIIFLGNSFHVDAGASRKKIENSKLRGSPDGEPK
jgi:hypothetical protein